MPRRGKLGNAPGEDIHLTPPEIWERVEAAANCRQLLIPLYDPCPHPWTVDGLEDLWPLLPGQAAYVNPPFSDLTSWADQVDRHAGYGHTIMTLVPVRTSQPYWELLCCRAKAIAFWQGNKDEGGTLSRRVRFLDKDGNRQAGAPFDTAIFLATTDIRVMDRFRDAFSDVATIVWTKEAARG